MTSQCHQVDMREACPADTQGTQFVWSLVMVFVYPMGGPLFFAGVLWYYKGMLTSLSPSLLEVLCVSQHLQMFSRVRACVQREACVVVGRADGCVVRRHRHGDRHRLRHRHTTQTQETRHTTQNTLTYNSRAHTHKYSSKTFASKARVLLPQGSAEPYRLLSLT